MLKPMPQLLVRLMIGAALLLMLACGTAEEATPTSSAPTPTPTLFVPAVPAVPVLATATPTPLPGVTAVPTATSTPVPVGDQHALAAELDRVLADEGERLALAVAAQRRARAHDADALAAGWERIYADLSGERGGLATDRIAAGVGGDR